MNVIDNLDARGLLLQRGKEATVRGRRNDSFHLALVLEGGGMRGIVSIGMASVFEDEDLLNAFDSVHGSSAGACAAAYFSTGQSHPGASIYYEDINNRTFIDVGRIARMRPIMNVDFLIDDVMQNRKPLDAEAIIRNPGFLNIIATDATTGQAVLFNSFRSRDQLFGVLKASICIPLIAGRYVLVDGQHLIDGGLVQQIALPSALAAGATHVIILMTRRRSELQRPTGGFRTRLEASLLNRVYGNLIASVYRSRSDEINKIIKLALGESKREGVQIASITMPDDSVEIERLTIDGGRLFSGFQAARASVSEFLARGM